MATPWPDSLTTGTEQRQVCIDVLCAYLRMPYEPDTASEKYREGEREVRYTIIRLMRDHLRDPEDPTTWCGRDLDFTNATFDGGDFMGAKFTGGSGSFSGAKFTGGVVIIFIGAEFAGGNVSFDAEEYTGGNVSFDGAEFTGSIIAWGPFEPPAAWTALQEREWRQNEPPL